MDATKQALAEHIDAELAHDIGEVTAVGWRGHANMTFSEWIRVGNTLQQIGNSINWWVGDWLNYGEAKWGEMYAQAIEITGWEYERLRNAKWVSGAISLSLRNDKLSWSHHTEVAKLSPEQQRYWLTKASADNLRVRELRDAIRAATQRPTPSTNGDDDSLPFSSGTPRIHTNGNGYHSPVDEYEQQKETDNSKWFPPEHVTIYDGNGGQETITTKEATTVRPAMAVHFSSDTPEHYTPQIIVDAVLDCMGFVDLDPCSNSKDTPSIPATFHYTAEDDGLSLPWVGKVYMNPPYGREIEEWVEKLADAHQSGDVIEAIALVPSRTDTQWWQKLRDYPVCLIEGRLKFGDAENSAPFPSAAFYLGDNVKKFCQAFKHLGDIWQRIRTED